MILRALTLCCGLVLSGSAAADTCDELPTRAELGQIERIPAKEAFQRSEGQIVFMDARDLLRIDVRIVCEALTEFQAKTGIEFEILHVSQYDTENTSYLCYNAGGCYPVTEDTLTTSLSTLDEFSEKHELLQ